MARFRSCRPSPGWPACLALVLVLAACAGTQARDPHTYEVLAEASLPRAGLTREMLRVMGEVAREGAVALVLEEVGRDHGYDDTWRPGNRYYDRAAELVERSMEPMLSRMDPTPAAGAQPDALAGAKSDPERSASADREAGYARRPTLYASTSMPAWPKACCPAWPDRTPAPFRVLHGGAAGAPAPAAGGGARSGRAQRG